MAAAAWVGRTQSQRYPRCVAGWPRAHMPPAHRTAGYRRGMRRQAIPAPVGGVVAVGFLDEDRIIVGSHSGVGVFDVHTGARIERTYDENYNWYQGDPPYIRRPSAAQGVRLIRAAGLRG